MILLNVNQTQEAYSIMGWTKDKYAEALVSEEQLFKLHLIKFNTLEALTARLLMCGDYCIVSLTIRPKICACVDVLVQEYVHL